MSDTDVGVRMVRVKALEKMGGDAFRGGRDRQSPAFVERTDRNHWLHGYDMAKHAILATIDREVSK